MLWRLSSVSHVLPQVMMSVQHAPAAAALDLEAWRADLYRDVQKQVSLTCRLIGYQVAWKQQQQQQQRRS
jgi:hypothetical protein